MLRLDPDLAACRGTAVLSRRHAARPACSGSPATTRARARGCGAPAARRKRDEPSLRRNTAGRRARLERLAGAAAHGQRRSSRARRPVVLLLRPGSCRRWARAGVPQPRSHARVVAGLPERAWRAAWSWLKTAGAAAESHLSSRFAKTNKEMCAHALTKYQNL